MDKFAIQISWEEVIFFPSTGLLCICYDSAAPNDRFLSNAFKRCFRLSGVLLKLCMLILGCAKKFYLFSYSRGT